jgi:hypothetical protein
MSQQQEKIGGSRMSDTGSGAFDDDDLPPEGGPVLGRSISCPAPSILASGVPVYMARKAASHVGNDEGEQRRFILANADQPDEWWLSQVKILVSVKIILKISFGRVQRKYTSGFQTSPLPTKILQMS